MYCIRQCLYSCTDVFKLKLLWLDKSTDNSDESYMLTEDYVPNNCDEHIKLLGDGLPLLNEKVLAKYYHELVELDEYDMLMGDFMYWDKFQKWGGGRGILST